MKRTVSGAVRDRILDAGADQFAQYGFSKVTMEEIAHAAGMGKASIYYYFPTKDALFQAVVTREFDEFDRRMGAVLRTACTAADKLRSYQVHRTDYFNRLLGLNILDLSSSITMKPVFLDMFDEFARREIKLLRTIVQEGKDSGEFHSGSVERVALAFLHVVRGLRLSRIREARGRRIGQEGLDSLKGELAFVTELFLRGLQAGRSSPHPGRKSGQRQPHLIEKTI